jgi:hypothetical protein
MKKDFLQALQNSQRIVAVVGLAKNVGKTTLLNWLIKNLAQQNNSSTFGMITTGRDGEDFDLVGGHRKPKVFVPAGTFFSTRPEVIAQNSSALAIIQKLPYRAGGKRLWLVKALQTILTEIVGPASASEQIKLAQDILDRGADQVFIDGSLDRKSIALAAEVDGLVVVAGAEAGSLQQIKAELAKLQMLTQIECSQDLATKNKFVTYSVNGQVQTSSLRSILHQESTLLQLPKITEAEWIYFPAAFTERSYTKLVSALAQSRFIFQHPLHIQLSADQLGKIYHKIAVLSKIKIDGIALNSYSAKGNHLDSELLRAEIRKTFAQLPIIDVAEL